MVTASALFAPSVVSGAPSLARSPLHVDGKWIKDAAGNLVTLRGVALADLDAISKGDRNFAVDADASFIMDIACSAGWYVDAIRLTVHPEVRDETGTHGWLHYDPETYFASVLDPAVAYAKRKGKYVIIDWHYVGADWRDPAVAASTTRFWLGDGAWPGIAAKYANDPNVLFELFNEPGSGTWDSWKMAARVWIDGIRKKGANNVIIVGGPRWSQIMPRQAADLIPEANLAYACHIYPAHVVRAVPDWIEYVSGVAPVLLTEWGFEKNGPEPVNGTASSYGTTFKEYVDSKPNVGWIAWCFDCVYRPVMFDENWILLGDGRSTSSSRYGGGPADTADNYMGRFVKEWLAERAALKR